VRIAYLVPTAAPDDLLDRIFEESLSRWGGRRTPIIPTDGNEINTDYWRLLDLWDADIIYSYSDLSPVLAYRLYYSFAPSKILMHSAVQSHDNYTPSFQSNCQFLSALSFLPLFQRGAESSGLVAELIDSEAWDKDERDLADSVGFPFKCCLGIGLGNFKKSRCLRYRKDATARQFNVEGARYLNNVDEWLDEISKQSNALMLAAFADMRAPYLRNWSQHGQTWDDHLTVVIGDSTDDRLLMWNGQHRYSQSHAGNEIPIIRVSQKRLSLGVPEWLKNWIMVKNSRHIEQNFAKRTNLISCSVSKEDLNSFAKELSSNHTLITTEYLETPNIFSPDNRNDERETWLYPGARTTSTRFLANELELPASVPWHLEGTETSRLMMGVWAVDLQIDRQEDHSPFDNKQHVWNFPRRLRLETAVAFENYASDESQRNMHLAPPPPRPSREGHLTIWDGTNWSRPILKLPRDNYAFRQSLQKIPYGSPQYSVSKVTFGLEPELESTPKIISSNYRYSNITLSDKARDLLGVFQLFGSLNEALAFLTDPFWLAVIERLSPEEPHEKRTYIKEIAKMITGLTSEPEGETTGEQIAERALQFAGQLLSSQKLLSVDFDWLLNLAIEQLKMAKDQRSELKEMLKGSVEYLRNREFLWQGFHWKCLSCEHHNWIGLDRLTTFSACEICRRSQASPVAGSLHLRLNPFVQHAFASSSSQGPVFWCLKKLAEMTRLRSGVQTQSFSFAPAFDLYDGDSERPSTDLDITANINGKFVLVEVKKSFAGVNQALVEQLVQNGERLRPDFLMLAIPQCDPPNLKVSQLFSELASRLKALDVEFIFLGADKTESTDKTIPFIAMRHVKQMTWAAW
jgi:hypothetical protein